MSVQLVAAAVPPPVAVVRLDPSSDVWGGGEGGRFIRSATTGGVLTADTIAPTPPEMPRTFVSKSAISSFTAVQFRMRWSILPGGGVLPNVPSRLVVWRGPRAKYHVTLSLS